MEDAVTRALMDAYRALEDELRRTELYSLIEHFDRVIALFPRAIHHVRGTREFQDKLRDQLSKTNQGMMMATIAELIEQRGAFLNRETVDLMSGVTVIDWEMHLAIHRWENEGGAVR
jgi:predicted glycosyltransferase